MFLRKGAVQAQAGHRRRVRTSPHGQPLQHGGCRFWNHFGRTSYEGAPVFLGALRALWLLRVVFVFPVGRGASE